MQSITYKDAEKIIDNAGEMIDHRFFVVSGKMLDIVSADASIALVYVYDLQEQGVYNPSYANAIPQAYKEAFCEAVFMFTGRECNKAAHNFAIERLRESLANFE